MLLNFISSLAAMYPNSVDVKDVPLVIADGGLVASLPQYALLFDVSV